MARIRSTFPGQWTDEDFVSCSFPARLLALALRNEADDQGVFEWKPLGLKMRLMPADTVDMDVLLAELEAKQQIKRFEIAGRVYGAIRNFVKWQRPRKPAKVYPLPVDLLPWVRMDLWPKPKGTELDGVEDAPGSELRSDEDGGGTEPDGVDGAPVPHQCRTGTVPTSPEGGEAPNLFGTGSGIAPQREEGGGRRKNKTHWSVGDADATDGPDIEVLFERFWSAMPKRGPNHSNPKKPARQRFERIVARGTDPEEIIRGAERYAKQIRASGKDRSEGVAQALTFLNQERWADDADADPEPWRTDPRAWKDHSRPPDWPDAPHGVVCGPWRRVGTSWAYVR